jgi:PPOX class probable F420-dependent enzyme
MPKGPVPAQYHDILNSTGLAHVATIGPDGRPQSNPVWFAWDGEHVLLSFTESKKKYQNLLKNPAIALSITDPANPLRYIEIRGKLESSELDEGNALIDGIATKYTGAPWAWGQPGEVRLKGVIAVES